MSTMNRATHDHSPEQTPKEKKPIRPAAPVMGPDDMTGLLLHLQRTVGNAAVNHLLRQYQAQHAALPAAGIVHDGLASVAQRSAEPPPAEDAVLQAVPEVGLEGGSLSDGLAARINSKRGGGSPLDETMRTSMEHAFGTGLADVRVHTDGEADALNRSVSATAFTTGSDIFFSAGTYQPGSSAGNRLLGHELTHVVQQRGMKEDGPLTVGPAGDSYEQEAAVTGADTVFALEAQGIPQTSDRMRACAGASVQRQVGPIVQRLPINVGGTKYDAKLLNTYFEALKVPQDLLDSLFVRQDNKLWSFANPTAFFKILAALVGEAWTGDYSALSPSTAVSRKIPKPNQAPGTVIIGPTTYKNCDDLKNILVEIFGISDILRDRRVHNLAADPINSWQFDDWQQARKALETWNGNPPFSDALEQHRRAKTPDSKLSQWNPKAIVTPEDAKGAKKAFTLWDVCGQTAEYLISRMHDLAGKVELELELTLKGAEGVSTLKKILLSLVKQISLINIGNPQIHEFTIEKRPSDQAAVLHQGYLSAYNALWWAGLEEDLIHLKAGDKAAIEAKRDNYGKGRPINLEELAHNLAGFMSAKMINSPEAQAAWRQLPFHPNAKLDFDVSPDLLVRIWVVNEPGKFFENLGIKDEWVTSAVMQEVRGVYSKILAINT